ncbi:F0F1 ATP synthase subunit B [Mycoplasmatota bacterium]|nr:F0F1 ATP synthase subunit B [Mycoplasmatota bacterium]
MGELSEKLSDLVRGGLYPNPITFLTQVIATLILFYLLKRWVWKPMREFLAKRSDVIVGELESAKQARIEAEKLKEEYTTDLNNAKDEAGRIIENARIQALETKEMMISEAEKEASYKLEKAKKDIEQERLKAEAELKTELIDIAFSAAEKLVDENIDDKKNRKLIDKFITEIGE